MLVGAISGRLFVRTTSAAIVWPRRGVAMVLTQAAELIHCGNGPVGERLRAQIFSLGSDRQ